MCSRSVHRCRTAARPSGAPQGLGRVGGMDTTKLMQERLQAQKQALDAAIAALRACGAGKVGSVPSAPSGARQPARTLEDGSSDRESDQDDDPDVLEEDGGEARPTTDTGKVCAASSPLVHDYAYSERCLPCLCPCDRPVACRASDANRQDPEDMLGVSGAFVADFRLKKMPRCVTALSGVGMHAHVRVHAQRERSSERASRHVRVRSL